VTRDFFSFISKLEVVVYEPFLFEVELKGILIRYMSRGRVREIVAGVLEYVNIINEDVLHDLAATVALETGCRAVDAYYIATAARERSVLITNDRVMKLNAEKAGVEAYYLIEEWRKIHEKLKAQYP
ncbi:MAG: type II toxin-antitoxin system VapC family toxin, partial [Desulfurococcales archaeon]|nr:type II toxin-antitoxin system VapC family toxin [Desulfurococcales archaeon]